MTTKAMVQEDHPPCELLITVSGKVEKHGQAIENNVMWQGRVEGRVNQMYYMTIGALLSGITAAFSALVAAAAIIVSLMK